MTLLELVSRLRLDGLASRLWRYNPRSAIAHISTTATVHRSKAAARG